MRLWTTMSFRLIEALAIASIIGFGFWTQRSCVSEYMNTNDFKHYGIPDIKVLSKDRMFFSGTAANFSKIPVKNVFITIDAYDKNERIMGTARISPGSTINASNTIQYSVNIIVPGGYRSITKCLVIPHSNEGTGKLTSIMMPTW